jgi:glucan biosynthesis protein C
VLGCVLVRTRATLERACRFSIPVTSIAVGAIALWLTVHAGVSPMTERFIAAFASIAVTQTLIAAARNLVDKPIPIVRRLTDASFVVYLFHLPLIALLVLLLQSVGIPPVVKALVVTVLSFLLSYWAWLGITRVRSMSLLFDGIILPSRKAAAV